MVSGLLKAPRISAEVNPKSSKSNVIVPVVPMEGTPDESEILSCFTPGIPVRSN